MSIEAKAQGSSATIGTLTVARHGLPVAPLLGNLARQRVSRQYILSYDDVLIMTRPRSVRRFPRYSFDTRLTVSVHRSGVKHHLWGLTADISENGVAATVSDELRVGEVVWLQFSLANQNMEMRAAVRFQKGHFCGFEFLTLPEQVREQIRSCCERLCEAATPECVWHLP